jgi:hypothetical protein
MNEEQAREMTHRILEEFEDLLTEKGITVPSDDRAGDPDEAHLFGMEYSQLEEAIVAIILGESRGLKAAEVVTGDDWPVREIAIRIVDEFEELLAEKGIMVPSKDREGRPEEACLYGSEYYALEDAVVGILMRDFGGETEEKCDAALGEAAAACEAGQSRMAEAPEGLGRKP